MRDRLLRAAFVLLALVAEGAEAQRPDSSGAPRECTAVAADTLRGLAYGHLDLLTPRASLPAGYLDRLLASLSDAMAGPVIVQALVGAVGIQVTSQGITARQGRQVTTLRPVWPGYAELTSQVAFRVDRFGNISNVRLVVPGDAIVGRRIQQALAGLKAEPLPDSTDTRDVLVGMRLGLQPDTSANASQPLFELLQPSSGSDSTRYRLQRDARSPEYPLDERLENTQGVVIFWVDVDSAGVALPGSFGAAPASDASRIRSYSAFVESVRKAAASWRFNREHGVSCVKAVTRLVMTVTFMVNPDWPP
jgi:hypothetical protein